MDSVWNLMVKVSRAFACLGGVLLLLAAFMVSIEVVSRKLLTMVYSGSDELAAYLFAVGTTWSLAHVLVTRGHVRIDALYRHLPLRTRAALDIAALLMLGILALAMLDCGFDLAWSNYVEWNRSNTPLRMPLSLPQLPWLFGLILFAASIAAALVRSLMALARGDYHGANQIAGVASQDEEIESELASMGIAKARTAAPATPPSREK